MNVTNVNLQTGYIYKQQYATVTGYIYTTLICNSNRIHLHSSSNDGGGGGGGDDDNWILWGLIQKFTTIKFKGVRLEVLTMMLMKLQVFWDITLPFGEQILMFQKFIVPPPSGSNSPHNTASHSRRLESSSLKVFNYSVTTWLRFFYWTVRSIYTSNIRFWTQVPHLFSDWQNKKTCLNIWVSVHRILVGKSRGQRPLGTPMHRHVYNIKMELKGKKDEKIWIAFIWHRIGTCCLLLWTH